MTMTRRSIMWPLIVIAVGCIWLLMVTGAFPEAVGDLLTRSWPALLVLFGLDVLVGQRKLWIGSRSISLAYVSLGAVLVFLLAVVWFAYQAQADELRTDNTAVFAEAIPDDVDRIRVEISVQRTSVSVQPAQDDPRQLTAEFAGSNESDIEMLWEIEGDVGVLRVREAYQNAIPRLEDYGRGTLELTLPTDVVIALLNLSSQEGDVTLALRPVELIQVDVTVEMGDLGFDLPELPQQLALTGRLVVEDGALDLRVPQDMLLTLSLDSGSGEPAYQYDRDRYDLLRDGTLKRRNTEAFQIGLVVNVAGSAPLVVTDVN